MIFGVVQCPIGWWPAPPFAALFVSLGAAGWLALATPARAQFATNTPTQSELVNLDTAAQGAALADIVRGTWKGAKCPQAKASLEKTFDGGVGGWLVQCAEGFDFWVMIPTDVKRAAITLPCIMARVTAGADCYANQRTILPDTSAQCTRSPFPDRAIGACTAIIRSGRIADKPALLSTVYQARGIAFLRYQTVAFALALSDFDRAVELNPRDPGGFYNRAVALERKGDLDQAIRDLDAADRLAPGNANINYERGYSHLKKRDYDRAIVDFDQAIRIDPDFAKAYQQRAAAYQAKGDTAKADADVRKAAALDPKLGPPTIPPAPAVAPAPAPAASELSEADRQAAYCMEASFGFSQRYTRLIAVIRQNVQTASALLDRPDIPATSKDQIRAQLKSMTDGIATNETTQRRWQANVKIFLDQLKRRGLLDKGKLVLIEAISREVSRDQQTVSDAYASCLRLCKPDDPSCKAACDDRATKSEASRRMMACDDVAARLK